jgi:uroporphyrinogen-III synthase
VPGSSTEILLTRPEAESVAFAGAVSNRWPGAFTFRHLPLTRIEREAVVPDLSGVQALLFTSANGVRAFAAASERRDLPALCVGEGTAAAARLEGMPAESAGGDAGALSALAALAWQPGAGDYLHVRGRDTTGDLAGALAAEGIGVREAVLYDARAISAVPVETAQALEEGRPALALFFSPRAASLFAAFAAEAAQAGRGWALGRMTALAISRAAGQPVAGAGFRQVIAAPAPDRDGMLAALGQFVRG